MQIVNLWYELARQNKVVKGFIYGRKVNEGAGNEVFPLTHLDDPILGVSNGDTITYTCNVDITGIPDETASVQQIQDAAFMVGLSYWQKIKETRGVFRVSGYTFITLCEYYDNDAAGVRFTYQIISASPVSKCEEYFDPAKQFPNVEGFPDFVVDNPDGCAVFSEKGGLPNFKIDI